MKSTVLVVVVVVVWKMLMAVQGQGLPGPVSDLQVTATTSTTLSITWTVFGSIDQFEVTYSYTVNRCSAPQGAPRTDTISDVSMRLHTLRDLNEDSSYTITVTAVNSAGSTMATIAADTSTSGPSGIPGPISFSDVNLTSITVQWSELPCSDRNGEITGYTVEYSSTKPLYTNAIAVSRSSNTRLVVRGLLPRTNYTFSVRAQGAANARNGTRFTATPTVLGFFLNGELLPNNSIVLIGDIGEGSSALYCLTDRELCCSRAAGAPRGLWRGPEGNVNTNQNAGINAIRGFSSISLNRKRSTVMPTGVYTCLIPSSSDTGSTSTTLRTGILSSSTDALTITGNRVYQLGETSRIRCSTEVPVQSIQWFDGSSVVVRQGTSVQELVLDLTIADSHNNSRYTCRVSQGTFMESMMITIMARSPTLSAVITARGRPVEGQRYTLTCAVSGDELLAPTNRRFRWDKGSSTGIHNAATLTFNQLRPDYAGDYRCTASFDTHFLTRTQRVTERVRVAVLGLMRNLRVTTPTATTFTITWTVSGSIDKFEVMYSYIVNRCSTQGASQTDTISDGSMRSYTLRDLNEDSFYTITVRAIYTAESTTATITANTSTSAPSGTPQSISFSDVNLTSITVQWREVPCSDRNGEITGYTVEYSSTTPPPHTNIVTVSGSSNTRLVVGGLLPRTGYTFSVRAQRATRSRIAAMFTSTPLRLGFFLNGTLLSNNSIALLSDIGEVTRALYCLTTRTRCCSTEAGGAHGQWTLPDGSSSDDTSFIRGYSSILLNRRSSAVGPTGVYTCEIPDATNVPRNIYIGIYNNPSTGPLTASLSYNCTSHTLNCVSSGGPVNTVTWKRNGVDISLSPYQLWQRLVNATTSTYHNLLTVTSGDVEDYIGSFSCTVSNSRGSSPPQSLDVNALAITGNERSHQISSSVNIICSSDLAVQTIRWLNNSDNGQELFSNSGEQQLLLPIARVTSSLRNTMYTCEVQVMLATGVRVINSTITFRVNSDLSPRLPTSAAIMETFITSSSATIQWVLTDPYNPSQPETFHVSYGATSGQLNMSTPGVTANPTSQTYSTQLNSLQPATVYFYRIESRNSYTSVFSEAFFFETFETRPSVVTGLQSRSANDTTLSISWEPPANPNGVILSYNVSIINLSDGSTVRQETTLSTDILQANLVPGVPYNLSIAAVNKAGQGEFSVFVYFTRELVPSISPKNVSVTRPSATVMVVSWIPLSYSEARGFISHYTVAYSPLTGGRKRQALDTMTQTVPGMDTNTTRIEGLDANTDYIVQVSATNGAGSDELSPPVLAAAPIGSQSVQIAVIGIAAVVVIALLVVAALILIIVILALKMLRYKQSAKIASATEDAAAYDVLGAHCHRYDSVKKEEQVYSEIKPPSPKMRKGRGFTLTECPAYATPIPTEEGTVMQPAEYEEVHSTSHV